MFLTTSYYSEEVFKGRDQTVPSVQNYAHNAYLFMCNKGSLVEPRISNFGFFGPHYCTHLFCCLHSPWYKWQVDALEGC